MAEPLSRENLLHVLKPDTEFLLNRHLATSEEWFPHEYVPYGRGRDFDPDHVWTEEDSDVRITDKAVRSALLVNLLTEDNLPYYFRTVEDMFGPEDAWGTWARRWTAEEGRHAMAIYGYLMVTQAIDPSVLERARMAQVSKGQTPSPHMMPDGSVSIQDGFIYLALQELATRISHRNTGLAIPDPKGVEVMKRVAGDENLHQLFYRDLAKAALGADPSGTMKAIERQVSSFAMPGEGITDFTHHARLILLTGIFGVTETHKLMSDLTTKTWNIEGVEGLDDEAKVARDKTIARIELLGKLATREKRERERYKQKLAA